MPGLECTASGQQVRFVSLRSAMFCAIDAALDAAESSWSPKMFDALEATFGSEWRSLCQKAVFQPSNKSACHLPAKRGEKFDLNTLLLLLLGLHRISAFQVMTPANGVSGSIHDLTTSINLPGSNVYAQHDQHQQQQQQERQHQQHRQQQQQQQQSEAEPSDWIQHLACVVFAFRQQYAHKSTTVSPQDALDALLAVGELWPGEDDNVDLTNSLPHGIASVEPRAQLQTAIELVRGLCHMQLNDGTSDHAVESTFSCQTQLALKMVASQVLHITTQWSDTVGGEGLLCKGGLKMDGIKAARRIAFHCAKASADTIRNGLRQAIKLSEVHSASRAEDAAFLSSLQECLALIAKSARSKQASMRIRCCVGNDIPGRGPTGTKDAVHHFVQQPRARPQFFGRHEELGSVMAEMRPGHMAVLCGTFGCGKTAMAVELAYLLRSEFPIQFWLLGSSPALLQSSLNRVKCIIEQTHGTLADHYDGTPPGFKSAGQTLLVVDGVNEPSTLETCKEFRDLARHTSIICTSLHSDPAGWASVKMASFTLHSLQAMELSTTFQHLMNRCGTLQKSPQALVEFIVTADGVPMLDRQISQPLAVASLASALSNSREIALAVQSMQNAYPACGDSSRLTLANPGDITRFHNPGPRAFLARTVQSLSPHSRLLLYSLALLCRTSTKVHWSTFHGVPREQYGTATGREWESFLMADSPEWRERRQLALDGLCSIGLANWCPVMHCVKLQLLVQREAAGLEPSTFPAGSPSPSRSDLSNSLAMLLCYRFEYLAQRLGSVADGLPGWQAMLDQVAAAESLLATGGTSDMKMKLQLQLWIARSKFTTTWLDASVTAYTAALETAKRPCGCGTGVEIVVQLELGMLLWRTGSFVDSTMHLEEVSTALGELTDSHLVDPCSKEMLSVNSLRATAEMELLSAQLNQPDTDSASLCDKYASVCADSEATTGGRGKALIGLLAMESIEEIPRILQEGWNELGEGHIPECLDIMLRKVINLMETEHRGQEAASCLIIVFVIGSLCQFCDDEYAVQFYKELIAQLTVELLATKMHYVGNLTSLPRIGLEGGFANAVNQAYVNEHILPAIKDLALAQRNLFADFVRTIANGTGDGWDFESIVLRITTLMQTKAQAFIYIFQRFFRKLCHWSIHPEMIKAYIHIAVDNATFRIHLNRDVVRNALADLGGTALGMSFKEKLAWICMSYGVHQDTIEHPTNDWCATALLESLRTTLKAPRSQLDDILVYAMNYLSRDIFRGSVPSNVLTEMTTDNCSDFAERCTSLELLVDHVWSRLCDIGVDVQRSFVYRLARCNHTTSVHALYDVVLAEMS